LINTLDRIYVQSKPTSTEGENVPVTIKVSGNGWFEILSVCVAPNSTDLTPTPISITFVETESLYGQTVEQKIKGGYGTSYNPLSVLESFYVRGPGYFLIDFVATKTNEKIEIHMVYRRAVI